MTHEAILEPFYCATLPRIPSIEIERDGFTSTFESLLSDEYDIVFLDGSEGSGKSTCLSQFFRRHIRSSFGLFVRNVSQWESDPLILQGDLIDQLRARFPNKNWPEAEEASTLWRKCIQLLRQEGRSQNHYFVIDGLSNLKTDPVARSEILEMLPFGVVGVKFLLSGRLSEFPELKPRGLRSKELFLPSFTIEETRRFFGDISISDDSVLQLQKAAKGIPAKLEAARRLLLESEDPNRFVDELPERLPTLFELDWRPVEQADQIEKTCLAILAFQRSTYTKESLATIAGCSAGQVEALLDKMPFLEVSSELISFVSDGHREYAKAMLRGLKEGALQRIIDYVLNTPSREGLLAMPAMLIEARRHDDLLHFLSPEHTQKLVQESSSWKVVHKHLELGMNAAENLQLDGEFVRMGIQESTVLAFDDAHVWRAEVEACVAMGDYADALKIADNAMANEDRVHLLSIIARSQRDEGVTPDEDLITEIRRILGLIDLKALGDKGLDIARELLSVHPELAVSLANAHVGSTSSTEKRDHALAVFTVEAFDVGKSSGSPSAVQKLLAQINDPRVKSYSTTVQMIFGGDQAAKVISDVREIKRVETRIAILRLWCVNNAKRDDALDVVAYALDLLIGTASLPVDAAAYKEIATPLLHFHPNHVDKAYDLVTRISGQKTIIEKLGPTDEFVSLELTLAVAEMKYNVTVAVSRLQDIYLYALDVKDAVTRAACLAQIWRSVHIHCDSDRVDFELLSEIETPLDAAIELILSSTARHYQSVKGVVDRLARVNLSKCFEIASRLNTSQRRDRARARTIISACALDVEIVETKTLLLEVEKISDPNLRQRAVMKLTERLCRDRSLSSDLNAYVGLLRKRIGDIPDVTERTRANCLILSAMKRDGSGFSEGEVSEMMEVVSSCWESQDNGWERISTGFHIALSLAEHDPVLARSTLQRTRDIRSGIGFGNVLTAITYIDCVRLCIQCSVALARRTPDQAAIEQISTLIERVNSAGVRATLFSDLALGLYLVQRSEPARALVEKKVLPLLDLIKLDNLDAANVLDHCSPAIYAGFPVQAKHLISKLPEAYREQCYWRIIWVAFCKVCPHTPFEHPKNDVFELAWPEIQNIIELIKHLETDHAIYRAVTWICKTMSSPINQKRYSRGQRSDAVSALRAIISGKLPAKNGIQHEGYVLACEVQLASLISDTKITDWEAFENRASMLGNVADEAFVLAELGGAVPNRYPTLKSRIFSSAKAKALSIPTLGDRLEHLEMLVEETSDSAPDLTRELIRLALSESAHGEGDGVEDCQKRIVDFAHRIDQDIAATLAALGDDDPAKRRNKAALRKRLDLNMFREKVANDKVDEMPDRERVDVFVDSIITLHGQLNASRVVAKSFDLLRPLIREAGNLPLDKSYHVLSWVISNMAKKYSGGQHSTKYIKPLLDAAITGAELAARIGLADRYTVSCPQGGSAERGKSIVVGDGDRERAKSFLKDWVAATTDDNLWIVDPFFGPSDLKAVLLVREARGELAVSILTGRAHNIKECGGDDESTCYTKWWQKNVADQGAGICDITIVGTKDAGKPPFHDRYWICGNEALRVGTSFNSLGYGKISEISVVEAGSVHGIRETITPILMRQMHYCEGTRLVYRLFSL